MSDIDFQNGFICGMATKGLVRSGELYKPKIWNDEGIYDYFYIDFRRTMTDFSTGMFDESIVVHDSVQLPVLQVAFISTGIYKVYCDISNRIHGITVLNKKTSLLSFSNGEQLPVFSIHMFISGQDAYVSAAYVYGRETFSGVPHESMGETVDDMSFWESPESAIFSESMVLSVPSGSISENDSIVLT